MCGFAGFCRLEANANEVNTQLLQSMAEKIAHRGPDDQGIWLDKQHGVGLANRRLAIIDLSPTGHMPMHDQSGSLIISYNGEIYNYCELRSELESLGYVFHSDSDTETILHGYRAWGISVLEKLDGFFAFALFDRRANELFLVRDRVGIKPLYFTMQGGFLSFASEIKALWELPWMRQDISAQGLYHYLTFMVTPAPYTLFQGIYKLPAGHYVHVDSQRHITYHEWYDILKQEPSLRAREYTDVHVCVEQISSLLVESTKKRMVADVPVGAFLSGGIDSSLNVALMSRFVSKVKTFTISFADGPEHDELAWARLVAQRFETEHYEITITEKDAANFFESMVYYLDEPLADCVCIPFYFVSKLARDMGVKVVQVGEGADELFFGYPVYAQHAHLSERWWKPAQRTVPDFLRKPLAMAAGRVFKRRPHYVELIDNWVLGRGHFWSGAIAFSEKQKELILAGKTLDTIEHDPVVEAIYPGLRQEFDSYAIIEYHRQKLFQARPTADLGQEILYLELKHRLPELLLMRADKMSMATSVEAREPFLDYRLLEFMFNVPLHVKY
ncbi:asparagine synthase (glutamine-hydrolyzing), partial [Candidatus Dependentiae bacterium]|nr:asparagine synthase (glutamine-hydrolyzing) [Candidatus Dependentiae bacterium]